MRPKTGRTLIDYAMRALLFRQFLNGRMSAVFIDEVYLAFASNIRSLDNFSVTAGVDYALTHLEQAHIHRLLSGEIAGVTGARNKEAFVAKPLKQTVLTNVIAVLLQDGCQCFYEHRVVGLGDRISKDDLRFIPLDLLLKCLALVRLVLESGNNL